MKKISVALKDPDYNWVVMSIPVDLGRVDYFHWYLSIVPKITKTAGFELGSGMYINVALPEESAEFLRNTHV